MGSPNLQEHLFFEEQDHQIFKNHQFFEVFKDTTIEPPNLLEDHRDGLCITIVSV